MYVTTLDGIHLLISLLETSSIKLEHLYEKKDKGNLKKKKKKKKHKKKKKKKK